MVVQLVAAGQRVAVSANSNEAINHVLRKVQERLDLAGSHQTNSHADQQQQLSQPIRANQSGNSALSCLDYGMLGHDVVPPDRGVFLASSWRMAPSLTAVVSDLFYDGQPQAAPGNAANTLEWDDQAQGLVFEAVEHGGNSTECLEEEEHIAALVERLQGRPYQLANGLAVLLGR